jgi:glucose-6-phosphate isomerase
MTERIDTSGPSIELSLGGGAAQAEYEAAASRATSERWVERLNDRDASLWSSDPKVQEAVSQRLGWLDAPRHFADQVSSLETFGDELRENGFTSAVVAGMGGSSLAPKVLVSTFGESEDWLELRVLDSTDPAAVAATVDDLDPLETLFIVATKSGTTTEPLAFQADAWARVEREMKERHVHGPTRAGDFMALISDPGRSVEAIPHQEEIPSIFLNPPDIGGRYSALTYVGLMPASLIGLDLDELLASAQMMLAAATTREDAEDNPALSLGLAIGTLAKRGRDKLTFIADEEIASLGMWLEQLIAESTGKRGVGIVPVDQEPLGPTESYGDDRAFVRLSLAGGTPPTAPDGTSADDLLGRLSAAGHPVLRIRIQDPMDLGGEFVRWEVATAIAGVVLGIDPFDQPNVEEAKERTRTLLEHHGRGDGKAVPTQPIAVGSGLTLFGDAALGRLKGGADPVNELRRHLDRIGPADYLALQAFIAQTPERDAAIARIRRLLRDRTRRATTSGYGPRFLHSTGQLHKGGAPIGWFLQLTSDHPVDRPIPGWPYSFGELIDAQAAGDFGALEAHDRPILRVHLGADPDAGLAALERALAEALDLAGGATETGGRGA